MITVMTPEENRYDNWMRKHYPEVDELDPLTGITFNYVKYSIKLDDGTMIGSAMVYDIDKTLKQAEIGLSITSRPHRGKGYGTKALSEIIEMCKNSGFHRVYCKALETNSAALHYQEKCGFKQIGKKIIEGHNFIISEIIF